MKALKSGIIVNAGVVFVLIVLLLHQPISSIHANANVNVNDNAAVLSSFLTSNRQHNRQHHRHQPVSFNVNVNVVSISINPKIKTTKPKRRSIPCLQSNVNDNVNDNANNNDNDNSGIIMCLSEYLDMQKVNEELTDVILGCANACALIAMELRRLPLTTATATTNAATTNTAAAKMNVQGEVQKEMDVIANEIFIEQVAPTVAAMTSEEEEHVIPGTFGVGNGNAKKLNRNVDVVDLREDEDRLGYYAIAFDPLDGSSNLDVNAPTGSIFGIAPHTPQTPFSSTGRSIVAAGYAVYSSSVELVISLELESSSCTTASFVLLDDTYYYNTNRQHQKQQQQQPGNSFILTRQNITCPTQGTYYSLNDAREPDWPQGLQKWIYDAKRGSTPSKTKYSARYICSLCADVHRTILKGGWAGNPRPHLRLLYEAAPLAFVLEKCGGRGSDGVMDLLDIIPDGLHCRTSVFLGSVEDISELEGYGDIQQGKATYSS